MNIVITLQAEERFLDAIEALTNALSGKTNPVKKITTNNNNSSAQNEDQPETQKETVEILDIAKVRAITAEASQAGKKEGIKKLLEQLGVKRVTDLQPDQFSEFVTEIKKL